MLCSGCGYDSEPAEIGYCGRCGRDLEGMEMPADRKAAWIKKHGESKSVKKWLTEHPPPADFEGTPQDYAFAEMEEEPIDDPLEPDLDEFPEGAPVTRREHDALREQVARVARGFNRAIKRNRTPPPDNPPAPAVPVGPAPIAPRRGGMSAILEPLARKR